MREDQIRFLVSSKLLQLRITEAHQKYADEFRIEKNSILFIKDDMVVTEIGIVTKDAPSEGLVDWYKWLRLANIMKYVTEQPTTILYVRTSETTYNLEILHLTL